MGACLMEICKMKKFKFCDYSLNELYKQFGCTSIHLMPFDESETKKYNPNCGLSHEEYVEELEKYRQSTVYEGIRYFFTTPERLKAFCELIEGG